MACAARTLKSIVRACAVQSRALAAPIHRVHSDNTYLRVRMLEPRWQLSADIINTHADEYVPQPAAGLRRNEILQARNSNRRIDIHPRAHRIGCGLLVHQSHNKSEHLRKAAGRGFVHPHEKSSILSSKSWVYSSYRERKQDSAPSRRQNPSRRPSQGMRRHSVVIFEATDQRPCTIRSVLPLSSRLKTQRLVCKLTRSNGTSKPFFTSTS